ncbi:MAG: 1-acyl-sn-glycerol-3-phosphate acyltransferase [Fluviicola sp.]|nr:1-acyl-sn-glycerol-3-phosphate acyltransferase [Fluviicola sp.]
MISTLIFYPIILPFLFSEKNKKKSFKLFVAWSWCVRFFGFYPVKKVIDSEFPKGPFVIVANHTSYLDIFLLPSIMSKHPFLFLGKSEILRYPLIKTYFKRLNIPVYRGGGIKAAKALISASNEIKKGWSLVIFPEGEIPKIEHPKMIPFMDGAFQLAKNAKVPIVPITFLNNYKRFSDPEEVTGPAGPGICKVYIHPFISAEEVTTIGKEELNKKCFDIVNGPIIEHFPNL